MPETEKRLENIERKLDAIGETLSQIAIQRDRIERLEERMHGIWQRYDSLVAPDGVLYQIRSFQSSCPRATVKWVWVVLVPMGLTVLGMGVALMRCAT